MPLICYERKRFGAATLDIIERANGVLEAYEAEGYDLTVRQLYYQFVSRDWLPNTHAWLHRLSVSDLGEVMRFLEGELSEEDVRKYLRGEP